MDEGEYDDDFDNFFNEENLFDEKEEDDGLKKEKEEAIDDKAKAKILESVWEKVENEAKVKVKTKRVRAKLTEVELTSAEKGLPMLKDMCDSIQFPSSKNDPYEKLDLMLNKMECWAHNLFPQMTFEDCLEKIEKLGHKRAVKSMMKRLRLGISLDDDMNCVEKENDEKMDEDRIEAENGTNEDEKRGREEEDDERGNDEDFEKFLYSMRDEVEDFSTKKKKNPEEKVHTGRKADENGFEAASPAAAQMEKTIDSDEDSDEELPKQKLERKRKIVIEDDDY